MLLSKSMAVSIPLMPGRSATLGRMYLLPAQQFLASQTTRRRFAPYAAERAEAKTDRGFPWALWGFWEAACLKGTELGFQFSNTRFCGLSHGSFPTGALLSLQAGPLGFAMGQQFLSCLCCIKVQLAVFHVQF